MLEPPSNAMTFENDVWWTVVRTGEFTPANGDTETFTIDRLQKIYNDTKEYIENENYPVINLDHMRSGEVYGMVDDVRLQDEKIQLHIAYVTPEAYDLLKAGKYPYRSVEIIAEKGKEYISGFAFTGYPAIDSMGVNAFSIDTTDHASLIIFSKNNNSEVIMMANQIKDKNIITPEEFQKKLSEFNTKISELEKQLSEKDETIEQQAEKIKQFTKKDNPEPTPEPTEKDRQISELTKQLAFQDRKIRKIELEKFMQDKFIPEGISKENLITFMLSLDEGGNRILEFDSAEKKSSKEFFMNILLAFQKTVKPLTEKQIDQDDIIEFNSDHISVNMTDPKDQKKVIAFVEQNMQPEENFNAAHDRLFKSGKIKLL